MKIKDILKVKGAKVWTVKSNQTIHDAVHALVGQNIGALLVSDEKTGKIAGIISERDIVRACYSRIKNLDSALVKDLMTKKMTTASPDDDINDVMAAMTDKRVRHIPVMEEGVLVGLVSIGDVVKALLQDSEHQIRALKEYMYGSSL